MHYYNFNIGDYRADTAHLNIIEHGIYRQLIDWYYLDEKQITKETQVVMRRLRLGSDELHFLQNVLNDFFVLTEFGYFHTRIERDIEHYKAQSAKNRVNGKLGGRPPSLIKSRLKTQVVIDGLANGNPIESQNNPNQELITNNHKPVTINKNIQPRALLEAENIPKNLINDFIAIRKAKKLPITKSAIDGIRAEAQKLNYSFLQAIEICCVESWAGFKADWILNKNKQSQAPPNRTDFQQSTTEAAYEKLFGKRPVEKDISDEATRV